MRLFPVTYERWHMVGKLQKILDRVLQWLNIKKMLNSKSAPPATYMCCPFVFFIIHPFTHHPTEVTVIDVHAEDSLPD